MSIQSINNSTTNGASSTSGITNQKKDTSNGKLTMDDFFQLMVAQLSNQDMNNTVDSTEYINQMAQFSMIQAITDLSAASATSYSVSLIGKEVALASTDSKGNMVNHTGIVEGVTLFNGEAQIVVDGVNYELSSVMAVKNPDIIIPNTET